MDEEPQTEQPQDGPPASPEHVLEAAELRLNYAIEDELNARASMWNGIARGANAWAALVETIQPVVNGILEGALEEINKRK